MQLFQNGAKVGQEMKVNDGHNFLFRLLQKGKKKPVIFSNYWLFHFILQ